MFDYIAKRYAEVLTKGDVYELFKRLEQRYGTISKACEEIGIERKTFYHWRNARQINLETKTRVLAKALEMHPIDTLEFLARKSRMQTTEILEILIAILRIKILETENRAEGFQLAKRAVDIVEEFSIPVTEYLRDSIARLAEALDFMGYSSKLWIAGAPLPSAPFPTRFGEKETEEITAIEPATPRATTAGSLILVKTAEEPTRSTEYWR